MSEKVLLSDAATRLGKSPTTLRKLVNSGKIQASKDSQGRHWVTMLEAQAYYAIKSAPRAGASRSHERDDDETVLLMREHNKRIERALEREERINDELRNQIRELERERTQHLAEMRTLLSKDIKTTDGVISRWLRR